VTPHLRAVIEVGNWEASRFALLGGQSGNPFSRHYVDLVPLHLRCEGVPIHWEAAEVRRHTVDTLMLVPSLEQRPTRTEVL
jgi:penicillin amidase